MTDDPTDKEGTTPEVADGSSEHEAPNPVTGEVLLQLVAVRDPDTPLFNETIDELTDQLPSLSNREPPAEDEQQNENDDENDRGEGEHD